MGKAPPPRAGGGRGVVEQEAGGQGVVGGVAGVLPGPLLLPGPLPALVSAPSA